MSVISRTFWNRRSIRSRVTLTTSRNWSSGIASASGVGRTNSAVCATSGASSSGTGGTTTTSPSVVTTLAVSVSELSTGGVYVRGVTGLGVLRVWSR